MSNKTIRIIQGGLIGIVLALTGHPLNTVVFWIVVAIMILQWLKEQD